MMSFSDCPHTHKQTYSQCIYRRARLIYIYTHIDLSFYFIVYTKLHGYTLRKSTLHLSFERKHFFLRWNYLSKLREWLLVYQVVILFWHKEWETENVEGFSSKTSISHTLGYSEVCLTVHYCKLDIAHRLHRCTDSFVWDEWHETPCKKLSFNIHLWKYLWTFPHMLNSHQVDDRNNTTVSN